MMREVRMRIADIEVPPVKMEANDKSRNTMLAAQIDDLTVKEFVVASRPIDALVAAPHRPRAMKLTR
jgi:hypothetical protein